MLQIEMRLLRRHYVAAVVQGQGYHHSRACEVRAQLKFKWMRSGGTAGVDTAVRWVKLLACQ